MNVFYVLDKEGGIDPNDLLGDLQLVDEGGKELFLENTFVDVWLLAFLRALDSSSEGAKVTPVEVLEEPYKVELHLEGENLRFTLENRSIESSTKGAVLAIRLASHKLLDELSGLKGIERNVALKELRSLLHNS